MKFGNSTRKGGKEGGYVHAHGGCNTFPRLFRPKAAPSLAVLDRPRPFFTRRQTLLRIAIYLPEVRLQSDPIKMRGELNLAAKFKADHFRHADR